MNIALIAHDSKKELMAQFCIAYCGILSRHNLFATGTTGKIVAEATGLEITRFLCGSQGGDQQIASRIACNEIDLLLIFRDPLTAKPTSRMKPPCSGFATFTISPWRRISQRRRRLSIRLQEAISIGVTSSIRNKLFCISAALDDAPATEFYRGSFAFGRGRLPLYFSEEKVWLS